MTLEEMRQDLLTRLYNAAVGNSHADTQMLISAVNAFNFALPKGKDGD